MAQIKVEAFSGRERTRAPGKPGFGLLGWRTRGPHSGSVWGGEQESAAEILSDPAEPGPPASLFCS